MKGRHVCPAQWETDRILAVMEHDMVQAQRAYASGKCSEIGFGQWPTSR